MTLTDNLDTDAPGSGHVPGRPRRHQRVARVAHGWLLARGGSSPVVRIALKAAPNLFLSAVVPALCFLAGRSLWGLPGAIALTLAWNASCQAVRRIKKRPFSGILLIGLIGLVLRAVVALVFNSTHMYFIAPAVVTAVMGLVFIGSAYTSLSLGSKVLKELIPDDMLDVSSPRVAQVVRTASLLYGLEQIAISVLSIVMVVNLSTTTYVTIHPLVSWTVFGLAVTATVRFLRPRVAHGEIRLLDRTPALGVAA